MNKYFFQILFLVAILVFFAPGQNVQALQKVEFPDSRTLQPLPKNIKPDISHNVNASEANYTPQSHPINAATTSSIRGEPNPIVPTGNFSNIIWVIVCLILAIIFTFFGLRKFLLY